MAGRSEWEDFLLTLLWGVDQIATPRMSRLMESYEAWEHRYGLDKRWRQLEERQLVVRTQRANQLVYQLTTEGRTAVMGGVNVAAAWERPWDDRWRMVLFDLPARDQNLRLRLWRWLRANRFGYLQGSVWIHPDPADQVKAVLAEFRDDVEAFTIMEAISTGDGDNQALVKGAWDFTAINQRHQAYIQGHALGLRDVTRLRSAPAALTGWLRSERLAWRFALEIDPLLPRVLWPRSYAGETAWQTRLRSFALLAE